MTAPLPGSSPQRVSEAVILSAEMQQVISPTARQRVDRLLEETLKFHLRLTVAVFRWWEVVALEEMRLAAKWSEAVQSAGVYDGPDENSAPLVIRFRPCIGFLSRA